MVGLAGLVASKSLDRREAAASAQSPPLVVPEPEPDGTVVTHLPESDPVQPVTDG
jgi:hypothetical protein